VFVTGGAAATGCLPPHPVTKIAAQQSNAASGSMKNHLSIIRMEGISAAISPITIEPRS
jgi:hypothetical protein